MAKQTSGNEPASPRQGFTFYAAHGRVYAENVDQKLVDLGSLAQDGERWCYLLDGNKQSAENFASAESALRHIADNTRFLYLDGQFTALADLRETGNVNLEGASRIDVMKDVLTRDEPMEDARV